MKKGLPLSVIFICIFSFSMAESDPFNPVKDRYDFRLKRFAVSPPSTGDMTWNDTNFKFRATYWYNFENDLSGGGKNPKKIKNKRLGRAILLNGIAWLLDSTRYWIEYSNWIEDWQFELNWEDQKKRFFALWTNRFDSNPFFTNWTHVIGGYWYYSAARYHRLNAFESLLFSIGSSMVWEYVTEWREVVSLNDNFFSGLGGMMIGESLFQFGNYFNKKNGLGNRLIGTLFNPFLTVADLFGGRRWRKNFPNRTETKPNIDLSFGYKRATVKESGGREKASMLNLGVDASYYTIPGFGKQDADDISVYRSNTLHSQTHLDITTDCKGVEEINFNTKAILFGYFRQNVSRGDSGSRKRNHLIVGGGSGFDFFKKRSTVYYDKGEYHIDFAADERVQQPTEFSDKMAVLNMFGPMLDYGRFSSHSSLRFSLDAFLDFALVSSLSLNEYSSKNDLYSPRLKTTLTYYGYYYAFGLTFGSSLEYRYRWFYLAGSFRSHFFDSIEKLDRFQDRLDDDSNIRDSRVLYHLILGYACENRPMKFLLKLEGIKRRGNLLDTTRRVSEQRIYCQMKWSF